MTKSEITMQTRPHQSSDPKPSHRSALGRAQRLHRSAAVATMLAAFSIAPVVQGAHAASPDPALRNQQAPLVSRPGTATALRHLGRWSAQLRADRVRCNGYEDAARRGDIGSHMALAGCYFWGRGRPQRFLRALHHYRRAAHVGTPSAHFAIGLIYQDGQHVRRDLQLALFHFKAAAVRGHRAAMIEAGALSLDFGDASAERACNWFEVAAGSPNTTLRASALRFLGDCYESGRGRAQNSRRARSLYFQSARLGDLLAQKIVLGDRFDSRALRVVRRRGCRRLREAARRRQVAAMRVITHCVRFARSLPRR